LAQVCQLSECRHRSFRFSCITMMRAVLLTTLVGSASAVAPAVIEAEHSVGEKVFITLPPATNAPWGSSQGLGKSSGSQGASAWANSLHSVFSQTGHSSASDPFNSVGSFGSAASGSLGFNLQIWQWAIFLPLLCLCCGALGSACFNGKAKKTTKKKKAAPAAAPAPAAVAEAAPAVELAPLLPAMAPLMPLTGAFPIQTYAAPTAYEYPVQYAAAPVMEYAAPIQYAAAPIQSYAAPMAMPMTTSYAAPVQYAAAPVQYAANPAPVIEYIGQPTYAAAPVMYAAGTAPGLI